MEKEIEIDGKTIWLFIDALRINTDNGLQELDNEFLCYWKLGKTTEFIYGELIKTENGVPKIFESTNDAIKYTTNFLKSKYERK